jgi:hypothetical protein
MFLTKPSENSCNICFILLHTPNEYEKKSVFWVHGLKRAGETRRASGSHHALLTNSAVSLPAAGCHSGF